MPAPFPPPPRASLTRADVLAYLVELQARGWEIYEDGGVFIVQVTNTDQMLISLNEQAGTCSFSSRSSAHGLTAGGPTVRNMLEFENYMRPRTGGPSQATSVHLKRGEPATNYVRLARLLRGSKVEAVYDSFLDDKGLANFLTLVRLDGAVAPPLRLLTSDVKAVNPHFVTALFNELGCPGSEIRSVPAQGHQGRFMLLSGGKAISLGMSLNGLDVEDDAHVGDDREHRPFFESEWARSTPVRTLLTSAPTPAHPPGSAAPSP